MNKILRIWLFFMPLLGGIWMATQKVAAHLQYDPLLGTPMIMQGKAYYFPWKYLSWYIDYHQQLPNLFRQTNAYVLGGFIVGLVLVLVTQPKKRLDSHGSAHWGEYDDIAKMDLISAGGVVVGLYDNAFTKAFTSFMRSVENVKKEKVAYAEMDFDKRVDKATDRRIIQLQRLEDRLDILPATQIEQRKKLEAAIKCQQNILANPPKYNPKSNLFTVYPWVYGYKKLFELYVRCPHFYLRDNSNKHLAVIAPTRSGKGVGLIIPTLLGGWKASVIINDIKSENWGVTAGYRKRMGQAAIKFEPTAEDGSSARWNPLDEIPIGEPGEVSAAQNLAYILADYEGKGKLDHWGSNAATVIMTVILHLKYAHFSDPENYPNV